MSEVFKVGDEVSYRNENNVAVPKMRVEFINGDAITCSYLERKPREQTGHSSLAMMSGFSPYSLKTIVLNAASLEKVS
ncbi:hypothetical protein ACET6Q_12285 [Aeromonas dhakensis]|uniref:hypothetical protein n=1 Tax=Aeromonas dhakensis TaxID=196024 RepID=UPI000F882DD9|nr:hypothetical protein [Aeromonas dhakensis]EIM1706845.1 hypothetical protein [Aeromonas dhakensis]